MSKRVILIAAVMALFAITWLPASAEPVARPDSLSRSILSFFTEMEDMQAPSWLVPGLRVVYKINSQDYGETVKNTEGFLIYDIVDVKNSYVASTLSTSHNTMGKPTGLMFGSVLMDVPTVGRFWITPDLFEDGRVGKDKYSLFYNTKIRVKGEEYDAMFLAFESQTASRTVAYDKATGLILAIDMTVSDADGNLKQSTTMEYYGTRLVFSPWYGINLTGLSTGTLITYKALYKIGELAEEQGMEIKVTENNGTWALINRTSTSSGGEKSEFQLLASSTSGDVYVLWLPPDLLAGLKEGETVFEEDLIGSTVKIMDVVDDPDFGPSRKVLFLDNASHTECLFSLSSGYMVSLHQKPVAAGIPEVEFRLVSIR